MKTAEQFAAHLRAQIVKHRAVMNRLKHEFESDVYFRAYEHGLTDIESDMDSFFYIEKFVETDGAIDLDATQGTLESALKELNAADRNGAIMV